MDVLFGLGGLALGIVGIVITILVSRHYYKRSFEKSLTPYIYFANPALAGIDPDVRKDLKISYKDVEVEDLFQLQLLIANTGQRAITSITKPLTLPLPNDIEILDVTILHIAPEGRQIEFSRGTLPDNKPFVEFTFPLLNAGDFFLVGFLLKGIVKPGELVFQITAEDLPPILKPIRLPSIEIVEDKRRFNWFLFFAGVVVLLAYSILAILNLSSWLTAEQPLKYFFSFLWLAGFCATLLFMVSSTLSPLLRSRPHFPLPANLRSIRTE